MRCSEVPALFLVADVFAQRRGGDPWRPVRVEVGGGACRFPDLGCGDVGDGAAEAVAYNDDSVGWVGRGRGFEGGEDTRARFEPAIVTVVVVSFSVF